ncbi:MAG: hypothetical protein KC620_21935 [Myxococcales bacterium]|nr:hypothetical protein [Myxococcales bacterium]
MIRSANDALFTLCQTFIVATADNRPRLDRRPFGVPIDAVIDPYRMASAPFLDLLRRLDAISFGPQGIPMDKWVLFDCAALPGFIFGFALPAEQLDADERALFGLPPDATGLVPISSYAAVPMYEDQHWFGHSLASLNRVLPRRHLHGLATITKALALKAFRVVRFVGATQWRSKAVHVHAKFGPLDLETAYTPAHSVPETLTYAFDVTDDALRGAMGDPTVHIERPKADFYLDADDVDAMMALQSQIELGGGFVLADRPITRDGRVLHGIARRAPGGLRGKERASANRG